MNHQPYENWILDDIQITAEEQDSLNQHLKECPECFQLQRSWSKMQTQLKSAPVTPAPAGFVNRWKTGLASRQKEQEKRQARTLLISLGSGAFAIMIALAVILLPNFSFISLIVGFLTILVKMASGLQSLWMIVSNLVSSASTSTLVIAGLLLAGWISLAALVWGLSIWRITSKGVANK